MRCWRHSRGRPDGALVVRGAGQVDGVLVHEVTRARFATSARSVGVAGTLDPEVGVGMTTRGRRRGRHAECPASIPASAWQRIRA
jgi:hypothetical protein